MEQDSTYTQKNVYGLTQVSASITTQSSQAKLYYHHDRLGSTRFVADSTGIVAGFTDYDEWGNPTATSPTLVGLMQLDITTAYTGYRYDDTLDIYFAKARMYDPVDKRFTARDNFWDSSNLFIGSYSVFMGDTFFPDNNAVAESSNRYIYCLNNPTKLVDVFGKYTEDALKADLKEIISKQMSVIKDVSTIFHNSTIDAINIILSYDEHITKTADKYGINKVLIQSVLLREIRWVDPTDNLADLSVIETKVYYYQMDQYINWSWYKKLIFGTPEVPIIISDDSSTGLRQIFAQTAINAYNWYYEKIGCDKRIDFNDREQRFEIWDKLRMDNEFNIDTVGLILLYEINRLGLEATATSSKDIVRILAKYNGYG